MVHARYRRIRRYICPKGKEDDLAQLWYTDIVWYGNLLELIGAIIGILQYLGAERIHDFAEKFNIWNSENFIKVWSLKIPVDRFLVSWINAQKSLLKIPFNNFKKFLPFNLMILLAVVATLADGLEFIEHLLPKYKNVILWIVGGSLIVVVAPLILYIAVLLFGVAFLIISIPTQILFYYLLSIMSFFLEKTGSLRNQLIAFSVVIVIIGLTLQVVGPIFQVDKFITQLRNLMN